LAKERASIAELQRIVAYDPATGILTWLIRPAVNVPIGSEAGSLDGQGYKHFQYKGVIYPCHQVAWALKHGRWPCRGIDHRDGGRSNNQAANLREASQSQNAANRKMHPNNKAGLKGVRYKHGKWEASIWLGKSVYLGRFGTKAEAHAAYVDAATKNFGDFARAG